MSDSIAEILESIEAQNKQIRVAVLGFGQMGSSIAERFISLKGYKLSLVVSHNVSICFEKLISYGVKRSLIKTVEVVSEAENFINKGFTVIMSEATVASKVNNVDCFVESTGVIKTGYINAKNIIKNKIHIVMLNAECDSFYGCELYKEAKKNNVVYTGSCGDEPSCAIELYNFAKSVGLDVICIGKGKNNRLDYSCTPQSVLEEARSKGCSARMYSSFIDGTKTAVELVQMSNATGFICDVVGSHGRTLKLNEINKTLVPVQDGGILNNIGCVEYVNGLAPGVFAVVYSKNKNIIENMKYCSMGEGPYWTLYRPYHLCALEVPLSVSNAVLLNRGSIQPKYGKVSCVAAVAKRNIKKGEIISCDNGTDIRGVVVPFDRLLNEKWLELGAANSGFEVKKDYKNGDFLKLV